MSKRTNRVIIGERKPMSDQSARDVIAEAFYDKRFWDLGGMSDYRDVADEAISDLRQAGYAIVRVPDIAFKGPRDTNGSMLITAAEKAESARYPVGGSNVGRAVAQVLREVAAAADTPASTT